MTQTHPCIALRLDLLRAHRLRLAGLLLAGLLVAACGGDEATPADATVPEVTPAAVAAPTSPLASPAAEETAPPAAEPATQAVTESVAGTMTETTAQPVVTATVTANGATAVFAPLEVDEGSDCAIESHLDLVGYPELEQRMGCPTEEARFDPIGIEEFGDLPPYDRFMLWFSHEKRIYVLLPDGGYQTFDDTWVEGTDPTHPCNPLGGEADSPPLPRRGFGKLWCENAEIQAIMGTVPREERLCQHAVLQQFASGRLLACFEDATVRYFRILDDSTWDVVAQ
jgi:hypothetical protein